MGKGALRCRRKGATAGGRRPPVVLLVARAVILKKIKEALGLDACLMALTGAAPLAANIMEYFASLDIDLLEAMLCPSRRAVPR